MQKINVLDEAELRQEFRRHYQEIGMAGCLQILYELLRSGEILADVMYEEMKNEK